MNTTIDAGEHPARPHEQDDRAALVDEIMGDISVIAARQRCAVARRLHHQGISMTHLQLLWILREHGDLSVSRLADFLGIAVPNATGLVDRMEQRGLVERDRDRADRRLVYVRPTPAGIAAADEIDGWRADVLARILDPLDLDQLERIASGMREARAAFASGAAPASPTPHQDPDHAGHAPTATREVVTT